jgi:hypothetical protein
MDIMNIKAAVINIGALIAFGLHASSAFAHIESGKSYKIYTISSFGTQFNDCIYFSPAGILTVGDYGPLVYRNDQLNTDLRKWQATPASAPIPSGFILSFQGSAEGTNGQVISGDAVNEFGDTFIFQGVVVSSCPARAATSGSSPYRKR